MFFVISKILWLLTAPSTVIFVLGSVGLLLLARRRPRWGRRLIVVSSLGLLVCGGLPLGTLMLQGLENRFPPAMSLPEAPAGIIVLGGAIDQMVSSVRNAIAMPEAGTRITEAAILARRYPSARIVFSGGSGTLVPQPGQESAFARQMWINLGVAPERITLEDQSRNTFENAQFSKALLQPQDDQTWILVTSAFHMPRSMGLFRAAGFRVVPDPVDFRTSGTWRDFTVIHEVGFNVARFDFAAREWIGLLAYWLSHKIDDVFPAP